MLGKPGKSTLLATSVAFAMALPILPLASQPAGVDVDRQIQQEFKNFACLVYEKYTTAEFEQKFPGGRIFNNNLQPLSDRLAACVRDRNVPNVSVADNVGVVYTIRQYPQTTVVVAVAGTKLQAGKPIDTTVRINNEVVRLPGTNAGAPNNNLVVSIVNAATIDGNPATLGSTIVLTAKTIDRRGQAVPANIEWQNAAGEKIGTGNRLQYQLRNAGGESIQAIATAGNRQQNWDLVSFTVSLPEIQTAPSVKVIDRPNFQSHILKYDGDRGFLCLRDDRSFRVKIKPQDKIIFNEIPALKLGTQIAANSVLPNPPSNAACFRVDEIFNSGQIIRS
jgi:hypothetical protein